MHSELWTVLIAMGSMLVGYILKALWDLRGQRTAAQGNGRQARADAREQGDVLARLQACEREIDRIRPKIHEVEHLQDMLKHTNQNIRAIENELHGRREDEP